MSEKKAHQEITAKLRAEGKRLLETGTVHTVIGFAPGSMPNRTVPVFITDPQDVEQLTWNPFCAANLSKYLLDHHQPGGKAAIVVKGCDSRGIVRLLQDNQVLRDEVHILGIPCRGQYDYRKKIPAGRVYFCCAGGRAVRGPFRLPGSGYGAAFDGAGRYFSIPAANHYRDSSGYGQSRPTV